MRPRKSNLNPNAASYIPFSQRGTADEGKDFEFSAKESKSRNEAVWFGYQSEDALIHGQHQNVSQSYIQCTDFLQTAELSKLEDHCGGELYASSSHSQNVMAEKFTLEEVFDMDLAYLQIRFPDIAKDCLSELYLASNCDTESAVDMLNQLEIRFPDIAKDCLSKLYLASNCDTESVVDMLNQLEQSPVDLSEKLPESLYIEDVLESASYRGLPLQKLKNMAGESGASTSGSSNLAFDNKTGGI